MVGSLTLGARGAYLYENIMLEDKDERGGSPCLGGTSFFFFFLGLHEIITVHYP